MYCTFTRMVSYILNCMFHYPFSQTLIQNCAYCEAQCYIRTEDKTAKLLFSVRNPNLNVNPSLTPTLTFIITPTLTLNITLALIS